FSLLLPRPPISTLFPYTTLFRSDSNIQTTFLSINSSRFREFYLSFSTISVILVNRKNQEVRDGNQLQSAVETVDRPWFEQNRHDAPCKNQHQCFSTIK